MASFPMIRLRYLLPSRRDRPLTVPPMHLRPRRRLRHRHLCQLVVRLLHLSRPLIRLRNRLPGVRTFVLATWPVKTLIWNCMMWNVDPAWETRVARMLQPILEKEPAEMEDAKVSLVRLATNHALVAEPVKERKVSRLVTMHVLVKIAVPVSKTPIPSLMEVALRWLKALSKLNISHFKIRKWNSVVKTEVATLVVLMTTRVMTM
mmetsp:Transcript_31935/g.77457  ORF Transcript_31935/g.77457 Transcript_31935/m.77457 type:complete len:205 (+) Transcript_31935:67-681(+)